MIVTNKRADVRDYRNVESITKSLSDRLYDSKNLLLNKGKILNFSMVFVRKKKSISFTSIKNGT